MTQKRVLLIMMSILFLSGCWDSVELDESIMVVGVGVSRHGEDEYKIVMEAIAPSDVSPTEEAEAGKSILLETTSPTLFEAAREIITVAKRRLFFTHTEVWIIHNELAMDEDMLIFLDILRREKMLRLNSFIFVSDVQPRDIFTTDYTFSNILSEELTSGAEYSKYVSDYPSVKSRDFIRMMLSPLRTGYLPTLTTLEKNDNILSQLTGSAIFKNGKMVGKLSPEQSFGLMWLNNKVEGGSITVTDKDSDSKVSFKLISGDRDLETQLNGKDLTVDIYIDALGSLADQHVRVDNINEWTRKFETLINEKIKRDIEDTLQKLQNEFNTDTTSIGIHVYRNQVHDFNKVKDQWDDIFSNATINIHVDTIITDKGLIESPGYHFQERKYKKLYQFKKED